MKHDGVFCTIIGQYATMIKEKHKRRLFRRCKKSMGLFDPLILRLLVPSRRKGVP